MKQTTLIKGILLPVCFTLHKWVIIAILKGKFKRTQPYYLILNPKTKTMKTFLPYKILLLLVISNAFTNKQAQAQSAAELVFQNPVLESGIFGVDASKYRFSNICSGIDAVIEIKGRSSNQVVLSSIDTVGAGLGYNKAFQPVLGIPGTAPANSSWWMDFKLSFYQSGTTTPVTGTDFYATGLDIDGDGVSINEWAEMYKIESIDSAVVNSLVFTQLAPYFQGYDYRVDGIIANAVGIDTNALHVKSKYRYANKNNISFRIGANNGGTPSSAAMRLNSIWFNEFYAGIPMPIKLISFTANLENEKAIVNWTTTTETNVSHFVIKKSIDGKTFTDAGVVLAYGNTTDKMNYSFSDNLINTEARVIYYKLCSVDIDGKNEYSQTRIIRISKTGDNNITITTYPNPVSNEVRITIPASWQNKKVVYELFSANGQTAKKMETGSSNQTETLNVCNLNSGLYFVKVTCEGQTAQQKIVKQ